MNLKVVGKQIREARLSEGLSQKKLAAMTNICRARIIDLEYGRRAPKWDKMLKLKEVLGVKIKI